MGRNNPYSPSPAGRTNDPPTQNATPARPPREITVAIVPPKPEPDQPTIAQRTYAIAKAANARTPAPAETYNIGIGDVLYINLKNSTQGAGYYTVHANGTIDYPLAGDNVIAAGRSAEDVEEMLATNITLYPDPQVEVKVREYTSHKITVSGMVKEPGEHALQRDAVPLYVIKADAQVDRGATKVIVTHEKNATTYDLRESGSDNILIFPGDSVEFAGESGSSAGAEYYFIGGSILSSGQKQLSPGLTLYQAIMAAGGTKGDVKRAVVRRKTQKGTFAVTEHNIKAIRDGKAVDPQLAPGDVIEIGER
jgi:polysaccharide export outer membrane protein